MREKEHEWGRCRKREREKERIPSRLHAVSTETYVGLDLTNPEQIGRASCRERVYVLV